MNIHTHQPIRIAAALALFAVLTAEAQAVDVPQVHVKYGDINLATTSGATVLYRRIRVAADRVCGVPDTGELARLARAKACSAQAVAEAVEAVDAPVLTGLYQAQMIRAAGTQLAGIR